MPLNHETGVCFGWFGSEGQDAAQAHRAWLALCDGHLGSTSHPGAAILWKPLPLGCISCHLDAWTCALILGSSRTER